MPRSQMVATGRTHRGTEPMEPHEMPNLPARIASKIEVHPETGCWLYQGYRSKDGYAQVKVDGKAVWFHRYMFTVANGREPLPGMSVDHMNNDRGPCRFRHCGCPDHIQEVTREYNSSVVPSHNGAKTHCPQGHEYAVHGGCHTDRHGVTRRYCKLCKSSKRVKAC